VPALLDADSASLESKLDGWLGRDKVNQLVDKGRVKGRVEVQDSKEHKWSEDTPGSGPARWFPDVGVELAAGLEALLRKSLDRIVPRFISAAVASGIAEEEASKQDLLLPAPPKASAIIPSHPIDVSVTQGLITQGRFEYQKYRSENPTEKGKLGELRELVTKWEAPRSKTYWLRVQSPADPTVEEVANTLYGSSLKTGEIVVAAPPLFGLSSASGLLDHHTRLLTALGADIKETGDALAEAKTGPLADELAKNQGAHQASKAQTKNDVLRSLDQSLAILPTIEKSGAVFGMGKNTTIDSLEPLRVKLTERRAKIAAATNDKDALTWRAGEAQQDVEPGLIRLRQPRRGCTIRRSS
jgi:hypothetical protein